MANCLNRAAASEFDWTSAAKDALLRVSAGGFGYPPAGLGLAPRFARRPFAPRIQGFGARLPMFGRCHISNGFALSTGSSRRHLARGLG